MHPSATHVARNRQASVRGGDWARHQLRCHTRGRRVRDGERLTVARSLSARLTTGTRERRPRPFRRCRSRHPAMPPRHRVIPDPGIGAGTRHGVGVVCEPVVPLRLRGGATADEPSRSAAWHRDPIVVDVVVCDLEQSSRVRPPILVCRDAHAPPAWSSFEGGGRVTPKAGVRKRW